MILANPNFETDPNFEKNWKNFVKPMKGFDEIWANVQQYAANYQSLCKSRILTKQQEQYLFRQYAAMKYRYLKIQEMGNKNLKYKSKKLLARIKQVNQVLVLSNMRLIFRFLRRKGIPVGQKFDDKLSDCYTYLLNAVDKFDYTRGNKFSTYLFKALFLNYYAALKTEAEKRKKRKQVEFMGNLPENSYEDITAERRDEVATARKKVNKLLSQLDTKTREIIKEVKIKEKMQSEVALERRTHRQSISTIVLAGMERLQKVGELV